MHQAYETRVEYSARSNMRVEVISIQNMMCTRKDGSYETFSDITKYNVFNVWQGGKFDDSPLTNAIAKYKITSSNFGSYSTVVGL